MPIAAAYRRAALMRATGWSPTAARCTDAAELKRALMSAHGTSRQIDVRPGVGRYLEHSGQNGLVALANSVADDPYRTWRGLKSRSAAILLPRDWLC
jgi:hypothetical protein